MAFKAEIHSKHNLFYCFKLNVSAQKATNDGLLGRNPVNLKHNLFYYFKLNVSAQMEPIDGL